MYLCIISIWYYRNPFDVVKTRLQLLKKAKGEVSYTGVPDAFVKIMKHEGPTAFFKGAACRMVRYPKSVLSF